VEFQVPRRGFGLAPTGVEKGANCVRNAFHAAVFFFLAVGFGLIPTAANAQMVAPWENKILVEHCSQGKTLVDLETKADELIAKNDPTDGYSVPLKAAAKVAYRCSQTTNDSYARDWYAFSFANDAFRAVSSAEEAARVWPAMVNIFTVLTRSPHADVRQAAKNALSLAKSAEDRAGIH